MKRLNKPLLFLMHKKNKLIEISINLFYNKKTLIKEFFNERELK